MNAPHRLALLFVACCLAFAATAPEDASYAAEQAAGSGETLVYFGTYTGGASKGIYVGRFDATDGSVTSLRVAGETANPSFVAIHPNRKYLYAVGESYASGGKKGGAVSAFQIHPQDGSLALINAQSSGGPGPCHVIVDRTGKNVLVANYGGGSVAVLPIKADGGLNEATSVIQHRGSSVNPQRQREPHAHSINLDAANRFAFVPDLGLDKVMIYRFDPAQGTLSDNDPPWATVAPGSGPRHFAFHPSGKYAYVINELSSTVTAFRYAAEQGRLVEVQTISTLPAGYSGSTTTAEVQVHPSGKFLYGSNRGHDSIAVFAIDPDSGRLTAVQHAPTQGRIPRNFGIDPTGHYLLAAHQQSNNIVSFRIDQTTGKLTPTGKPIEVPAAVCVKFSSR